MTIGLASLLLFLALLPEPTAKIVFANRIYRVAGPSQIDWFEIAPSAREATKLGNEQDRCPERQPKAVPEEAQSRAESTVADTGKLLTWSPDQTMFAYVAHDAAIPPPTPNLWGCTDCFYPVLKIVQARDGKALSTIKLPVFGEHWNYAQTMTWSPNGEMLLLGAEAGPSDSKYSDYWLVDLAKQTWKYIGGGNNAKWSPDSSQILWTAARELQPLGKIHVWVVHLALFDLRAEKQEMLTSGTSIVSQFYWCSQ